MNPSEKENVAFKKMLTKTESAMIYGKSKYNEAQKMINDTPIQIKILNVIIPFVLTYIFTYIRYNLGFSIFFAIITFFLMFTINIMIPIIFIVLYIFVIINLSSDYNKIMGSPIEETDISKNNIPYICNKKSLIVTNSRLVEELKGGYFSYSFWLYVNGNDNSVNNKNNWNSYRYREWKSIFYRGNPIDSRGDLTNLIQYPGFWLTPIYNNLVIVFQNGSYVERLEINNVPFNKWTNYSIVVETKSVSIYINGLLDRTLNLYQSITIMNGYNLYITNDKYASKDKNSFGFAGNIAELIFYNYALTQTDIYKSYLYYKKILDNYQNKVIESQNYSIPGLITNSDYNK
jgi:hypothetical protein